MHKGILIVLLMFFVFFSSILLPFQVSAQWSKDAKSYAKKFPKMPSNPYVASAQTLCNRKSVKYPGGTKDYIFKEASSDGLADVLRVKILVHKENDPNNGKLMVVLPGSFNNLDAPQPIKLAKLFYNLGYHVLVIPNPLGTDFVDTFSIFPMFSTDEESKLYYRAIRDILKSKHFKNIDLHENVSLFGVSYSATMAVIIANLDAESQKPQLISDVTAVSPAFDLKVAYDELDGTMKKSPSFSSYIDLLLLEWFNINPDWCGELEPDEDVQQELKNLNGFGFRYLLFQSVKKDLSTRQDKSFWPWNCLNLWDDINFNFYLQNYAPGVTKWLVNKNGEFLKWTEKLHSKKQVNLRILTTEDDYINKANVWDDDQKKNPTHYIVLPDGGHYGMSVYKEYENLLKYEFGDSGCIFPETENYEELNDSPKSRGFTDLN